MAEYTTVAVDKSKKLVRVVWNGRPDYTGIKDGCDLADGTVAKFKKGESLLMSDIRNIDIRFLPPGSR